ncbi:MAG: bifunctional phosphoribosylaminoimidazolecarboxamide formyltransferase/IMP cyclohydrolase [Alphaproteobacteria bacterium]|nr:bifunctional phosphoribosylaminoimidazolecarboxamide formyltransferase/IMP cyclohydrolase [Alphaproteobacteria bacterium]
MKIARALISVSDKTGLIALASALSTRGVAILSTGGSAATLRKEGIPVQDVSMYTSFPEMMDGRLKTLHPKIHGGILQIRTDETHSEEARAHNIPPLDLVVVNLYPFRQTIARGADFDEAIENIDIGGPAMVRAAAKNHAFVTVITDPAQYESLIEEMDRHKGATSPDFRKTCAAAAFAYTANYDSAVSAWFAQQCHQIYPETLTIAASLRQSLRYGENPHQTAAFYVTDPTQSGVASAIQVQGKELSYNNINDTDAAFQLVSVFTEKPAIAIIKHANPCGVATANNLVEAYERALACDSVSAFGGIIASNTPLDGPTAEAITKIFSEVIIAPDMNNEAKEILAAKKNLRVLLTRAMPDAAGAATMIKSVAGGLLVQSKDNILLDSKLLKCVTRRKPTEQEMKDLLFAFTVAKYVKSNTIVYAKNEATVGIGAGQMSRVDSARIAARKAQDAAKALNLETPLTQGSAAASDAFFPFADGLLAVIEAGASCVIQPGGSIRDQEVIDDADKAGIAMLFTGIRHFYH